jgi:hypothetical protein
MHNQIILAWILRGVKFFEGVLASFPPKIEDKISASLVLLEINVRVELAGSSSCIITIRVESVWISE